MKVEERRKKSGASSCTYLRYMLRRRLRAIIIFVDCVMPYVQNAAARLVSGVRRRDHTTPTLRRLHWLPVRQRVLFCSKSLSKRPGTVIPGRWLSARLRCPVASTPFVCLWILRRPTYPYHLRRPVFRCRWPTSVELLANRTEAIWQSWPVQTAIKDSFVWVMGPQRFVTLTPCKLAL